MNLRHKALGVVKPASFRYKVGDEGRGRVMASGSKNPARNLNTPGVRWISLTSAIDERGSLVAGQVFDQIPFSVARFFLVFDVPSRQVRGAHAHRECHQFLVAAHGSVSVMVTDGSASDEVVLDSPNQGLYVPPMIWGVQHQHSPSSTLMVLASHKYEATDYIRDFESFLAERGSLKKMESH